MHECAACKKRFAGEPFQFHLDESVFCSLTCYPEGTLDEDYAFTYAEMVDLYRKYVQDAAYLVTIEQRDDLANEIDYCMQQCLSEAWMDTDLYFYNGLLTRMHDWFRQLHDEGYDYFLDPEMYEYYEGLDIYWEELKCNGEERLAIRLETRLKEVLEEIRRSPDILYGKDFDAMKEEDIILLFPDGDQDAAKILHEAGVAFLEKELPKDSPVDIEDAVSYKELCECLLCGAPEPYEDFGLNKSYHVLACSACVINKVRKC